MDSADRWLSEPTPTTFADHGWRSHRQGVARVRDGCDPPRRGDPGRRQMAVRVPRRAEREAPLAPTPGPPRRYRVQQGCIRSGQGTNRDHTAG